MKKAKILVIEDEKDIRDAIKSMLENNYEIQIAEDGLSGLKSIIRSTPELILLDLNMPYLDGFQVCKALRSDHEFDNLIIIILTAYDTANDRTKAFELGADDYMSKPFDASELVARIQRKLDARKNIEKDHLEFLLCGNLEMNLQNFEIFVNKKQVSLSALEFKLLRFFILNKEHLLSKKEIIENVWENQKVAERIIVPHILSLRSKLNGFNYKIHSLYRSGYILKSLNQAK
jgi:DNA-binding response OmpR family regulator